MFRECKKFNKNISKWDVGSVACMEYMFYGSSRFNHSCKNWKIPKDTSFYKMFYLSGKWSNKEKQREKLRYFDQEFLEFLNIKKDDDEKVVLQKCRSKGRKNTFKRGKK